MKSGMRGGKPRDMATFKKGGTSRGAGAAKKGFDYAIYKKGGSIKKYEEGGGVETRSYASFGDWMKDLKREFGGKSEKAETPRVTPKPIDEERAEAAVSADEYSRYRAPIEREALPAPRPAARPRPRRPAPANVYDPVRDPVRQAAMDREEASRRAQASRNQTIYPRRDDLIDFENRAQRSLRPAFPIPPEGYAKGGKVKMAGGGSCRGMGAAQRGGKYTIK